MKGIILFILLSVPLIAKDIDSVAVKKIDTYIKAIDQTQEKLKEQYKDLDSKKEMLMILRKEFADTTTVKKKN